MNHLYSSRPIVVVGLLLSPLSGLWARSFNPEVYIFIGKYFVLPFLIFCYLFYALLMARVKKKTKEAEALLRKMEERGKGWEVGAIKERVREILPKVLEAETRRDPEIARGYVTERMYGVIEETAQENSLKENVPVRRDAELRRVNIVEVSDYSDDSKDEVWVYLSGTWLEYFVHIEAGTTMVGDEKKREHFDELWKLKRDGESWLLDEFDPSVTPGDFKKLKSRSEALGD